MNELQASIYEFGDFRVDATKRLLLNRDGETLPLTPKVFDTLLYLVQHPGTVLTKDELMQAIWPQTVVEENSNFDGCVSGFRWHDDSGWEPIFVKHYDSARGDGVISIWTSTEGNPYSEEEIARELERFFAARQSPGSTS